MLRRKRTVSGGKVPVVVFLMLVAVPWLYAAVEDAPTGFDNTTNGFSAQDKFNVDRATFEEQEQISNGLGPVYNAQSCAECHQNPVSGSASQINELRAGRTVDGVFVEHDGGSLVHDRAIDPAIQESVFTSDGIRTFRVSLNILGDGFVEAIDDDDIEDVQYAQPNGMKGTIVTVPVLEASTNGTQVTRIGRFGWKSQHASLLSFAADAYRNEMGITNPLFPTENTSNGFSVAAFDSKTDPEDQPTSDHPFGKGVEAFARFMRSTEAPARTPFDAATAADIADGSDLFSTIGCANCHTVTFQTVPPGTSLNGGFFVVNNALGDKTIHPYSDFMLHNVGTGDGIVQNGDQTTKNMIRTAPLWGLRTRTRLMHDGESLTIKDAILRHAGQASTVITTYNGLSGGQKNKLLAFLGSL